MAGKSDSTYLERSMKWIREESFQDLEVGLWIRGNIELREKAIIITMAIQTKVVIGIEIRMAIIKVTPIDAKIHCHHQSLLIKRDLISNKILTRAQITITLDLHINSRVI